MGEETKAQQKSLETLMEEFEKSGLSIDEFCKKHLSECGIKNPEESLRKIDETFARIDKHYKAIKEARKKGVTRPEYLQKVCNPVLKKMSPEKAGEFLSEIIRSILKPTVSKEDLAGISVEYSNAEKRIDAIDTLESALKRSVVDELKKDNKALDGKED
jgi:isopentenyl diphosphate isomerase/L-lactate dehydrogenase-like FMN-dependent dehydrogenase